ncbi:hypothetical protein TNCV_3256641 [Trichonephila clavipes]|nr:hypothetical protein TNCV_3256641 [Trichonephila clavipes]
MIIASIDIRKWYAVVLIGCEILPQILFNPSWQINLEGDSDDAQKFLDSHNQGLTIDELNEMHELEQDIEEV